MFIMGLDIGGTKCEVALIDYQQDSFTVLVKKRMATRRQRAYDKILTDLRDLVLAVLQQGKMELAQIEAIGVGMPGIIRPSSGEMLNGNSLVFIGHTLATDLVRMLDYSGVIYSENDANCFAYAEAKLGAGVRCDLPFKKQVAVGIILGTGCGGGIIVRGELLRGANGGAGEIGHTLLHEGGHACYCGEQGCAEQYLSGPALEASFFSRCYSQMEKPLSAKEIFALSIQGDPIASAVVKRYLADLALFLGNLTNILAPDYFVLGGGMSNADIIYEHFWGNAPANLFVKGGAFRVVKNVLGDSAGVIGAAVLAAEQVKKEL